MFKNIFDKAKQKFNQVTGKDSLTHEYKKVPTRPEDAALAWMNKPRKMKSVSRRRFFYIGLDDKKHSVRIGKPFSVRPKLYPDMIIATFGNRDMIRVYA